MDDWRQPGSVSMCIHVLTLALRHGNEKSMVVQLLTCGCGASLRYCCRGWLRLRNGPQMYDADEVGYCEEDAIDLIVVSMAFGWSLTNESCLLNSVDW